MAAKRIKDSISRNAQISWNDVVKLFDELDNRVIDEAKSRKFFSIEQDKQSFITDKSLFGEEVTSAFHSAIVDIEEAGECLAFERYTACVFHLCRIMEKGLRVLQVALGLPQSANPTWAAVLHKIDSELAKEFTQMSPELQSDRPFFAGAAAMMRSVEHAWRNPTMHIEKVYTEEQAEDIWNAVRGFMRHLATKLKE